MYVKRHAVVRDGKRYVYLRLVEAYRDESGRVRHRVLRTLGREDELKASGQLEQLAASFARLDPPPAGTRRHVGPLLLVRHYVDRLGLVGLVDEAVPMRGRAMLTHGEVIAALVANRLCGPAPLYDVTGWASSAAMAELFGVPAGLLNDDRLGRALEALAPVAERVRGELALAAASRCGADLSRLHLDMTAVRFTGGYQGSALVAKGWAADRTIARQVKTLQASTRTGVAVYYRGHPGASNEAPCLAAALDRIRELAPPGVICVADSGFGYLGRLCAADAAGLRFVVPLRADTGWAQWFAADIDGGIDALAALDYCPQRERRLPADQRTLWKGVLGDREVFDDDTGRTHRLRIAYIWSSEEATSVADARDRALTRAEEALTRIRNGLGGRYYKTRKQVDDRVATIVGARIADLITVTTGVAARRHTHHRLAAQPQRHHRRVPTRRALRHRHQPARPARPGTDRARRARHLQRPMDRRTTPPRPQTNPARAAGLPAQRRPHPCAHRRRRHRPAHLRPHRSRPARRPRPRHRTTRPAARTPRRGPHRARRAGRLHRPARHLHQRRPRPRPAHRRPTPHPRPPRHPPTMVRNPQHHNNIQESRP